MALVLICTASPVDISLAQTVFRRRDFARHNADTLESSIEAARALHPTLILLDRDAAWAERLITLLRRDGSTRSLPIVVVARGRSNAAEAALLDGGADSVLRLPAGGSSQLDLGHLVGLPLRRQERVPVQLHVDAQVGDELVAATILNLSEQGMLIYSTVPLHAGDDITFAFRLPQATLLISGSARVVRQATPTLFGVEFLALDEDDRSRIRSFVTPYTAVP